MGNSHGSKADIIGNGYVLTDFLNSASFSGSRDTGETTTMGKNSKTYIPGLKDTTMSAEGLFDGATGAADEVLFAALSASADGVFSYIPEGYETIGNLTYSLDAIETSYEITSDVGDVNQISAEFSAGSTGNFTRGKVGHVYQAEVAAGNAPSIDGAAASSNGGALIVHATAASSLVVFLQDSADNSTFADLAGSISIASGRSSVRLSIPGTIRRYTKVRWTGTGTFFAAVDRY